MEVTVEMIVSKMLEAFRTLRFASAEVFMVTVITKSATGMNTFAGEICVQITNCAFLAEFHTFYC